MRRIATVFTVVLAFAGCDDASGTTTLTSGAANGAASGSTSGAHGSADAGSSSPASPSIDGGDDDASSSNPTADAGTPAPSGSSGYFHTDGARIVDATGKTVRLTGLNWFGLETPDYAPHGLWTRAMGSVLDQIKSLGYNSLRIPFSSQLFDAGSIAQSIDYAKNPDLQGLDGIHLLDKLIAEAGARGLRVVLDRHRPDSGAQSALWYTTQYSEQRWISDWTMLATRYKDNTTVVGFDLHNEPHGAATWGDGNLQTDWRLAAERAGNAILAVNPELLIIVEGVEVTGGQPYWWGGNLRSAGANPVRLSAPKQLVYSIHDYPASVYSQPWFTAPTFPKSLDDEWEATWGYLVSQNVAPVWVGEFGTKNQTAIDQTWLKELASYLGTKDMSFAFWALNPDSGDTGGLLADDWNTVNADKQTVLAPILAPALSSPQDP